MVKLLAPLHQRVYSLLLDHEEHHALQQILDIIEMLQSFSMDTPVAKVIVLLSAMIGSLYRDRNLFFFKGM